MEDSCLECISYNEFRIKSEDGDTDLWVEIGGINFHLEFFKGQVYVDAWKPDPDEEEPFRSETFAPSAA